MSDSRLVEINDRTSVEFFNDGGCCIEQDLDRPGVTVYLEPKDRSALLWALLEEMAGEVVERHDYEDRTVWRLPGSSEVLAQFRKDALPGRFCFWFPGGWSQESTTQAQAVAMLCAIQEQRKREAEVQS